MAERKRTISLTQVQFLGEGDSVRGVLMEIVKTSVQGKEYDAYILESLETRERFKVRSRTQLDDVITPALIGEELEITMTGVAKSAQGRMVKQFRVEVIEKSEGEYVHGQHGQSH